MLTFGTVANASKLNFNIKKNNAIIIILILLLHI